MNIELKSLEDLDRFAKTFSESVRPGDIYLLEGEMGAGKTTFVRAVCEHLGITHVNSPTYTIVNRYDGDMRVYHLDLYRVETEEGILGLDLDEVFSQKDAVCFVEWAERLGDYVPEGARTLSWTMGDGEKRQIVTT